jgi:hypothetical protein
VLRTSYSRGGLQCIAAHRHTTRGNINMPFLVIGHAVFKPCGICMEDNIAIFILITHLSKQLLIIQVKILNWDK